MRFWATVLLLILMPLQLSWAAAGRYCQHEGGGSSQHIGHHTHQHRVTERTESGSDSVTTLVVDLDCGTCHAGCSMAAMAPELIEKIDLATGLAPQHFVLSGTVPDDRPDRPQWTALV